MWIMTPDLFVSIVWKGGGLMVRSRDRTSIERFCDIAGVKRDRIVDDEGTDYDYRVKRVGKRSVLKFLRFALNDITYSNFKNETKDRKNTKLAHAYSGVWSSMLSMAPPRSYSSGYWVNGKYTTYTGKYGSSYDSALGYGGTTGAKHRPAGTSRWQGSDVRLSPLYERGLETIDVEAWEDDHQDAELPLIEAYLDMDEDERREQYKIVEGLAMLGDQEAREWLDDIDLLERVEPGYDTAKSISDMTDEEFEAYENDMWSV